MLLDFKAFGTATENSVEFTLIGNLTVKSKF